MKKRMIDGDTCSPGTKSPEVGGHFESLEECCQVKACVFPEQARPPACAGVKVDCHPRHGALTFGEDCAGSDGKPLRGEALESCCMHRFNLSSGRSRQGYQDPHPFPTFCKDVVTKFHSDEERGDPGLPPE